MEVHFKLDEYEKETPIEWTNAIMKMYVDMKTTPNMRCKGGAFNA